MKGGEFLIRETEALRLAKIQAELVSGDVFRVEPAPIHDIVLSDGFRKVPHCLFLYALDTRGIQISDNVSTGGLLPDHYGRDRSQRPYMRESVPAWGFLLSDAYLSLRAQRPSLTALQVVHRDGEIVGYIGADFDLRDLPVTAERIEESDEWRQIKGDPAIRGTVFQQCRIDSLMDKNMDPASSI